MICARHFQQPAMPRRERRDRVDELIRAFPSRGGGRSRGGPSR